MSRAPASQSSALRSPVSQSPVSRHLAWGLTPARAAALAALLSILGVVLIWPTALTLWSLWVTDPLKSIGMLIPLASLALIIRVWRSLHWELRGTWAGLALLAATALSVYVRQHAVLVLVVAPQWNVYFPPNSLVALAYVSGAVLLFGGTRLFRAALFPIALILLVNPVPHIFNVFVDLPLQRVSAHVARAFAHALGQPLTPDQMRLMFTPDFGMFIAPGCNGIRGAVTMGIIALIVGYLSRFRWLAHIAFVVAAVLLGYVFNFVRLCTLVLYYIIALHLPRLQPHGEMADYIIGAGLFLLATSLLIFVVRHAAPFTRPAIDPRSHDPLTPDLDTSESIQLISGPSAFAAPDHRLSHPESPAPDPASATLPPEIPAPAARSLYPRLAAMALLILAGAISAARTHSAALKAAPANAASPAAFPTRVGPYNLVRSWSEYATAGPLIFDWADYAPAAGGTHIAVGISPVLGSHDTLICHSARGEDPVWHAELPVLTAAGPTSFSASFFSDGASQYLEATTLCQAGTCGEYSDDRRHFGLIYSRPSASDLFSRDPGRPIPIMLRAETSDTALPADLARQQLTAATRTFVSALDLNDLTRPYRH